MLRNDPEDYQSLPLYIIVYIHIIVYIFFKIKILTSRALDVSCMCSVRCEIMHLMMVELIFCYFFERFFSAFMFPFQLFLLEFNSIFCQLVFLLISFMYHFILMEEKSSFQLLTRHFWAKYSHFSFNLCLGTSTTFYFSIVNRFPRGSEGETPAPPLPCDWFWEALRAVPPPPPASLYPPSIAQHFTFATIWDCQFIIFPSIILCMRFLIPIHF